MAARPANGRAERVERRYEMPMLVAALPLIPVIAVEEPGLDEPWDTIAAGTDWASWIASATEVVEMPWVVPSRAPGSAHIPSKWRSSR